MSAEDKGAGWTTMKIDPEIFQELGVRDPEETKREMAISKRVRQVRKELKSDPDNLDLQLELGSLFIDGGEFEDAIKQLKQIISHNNTRKFLLMKRKFNTGLQIKFIFPKIFSRRNISQLTYIFIKCYNGISPIQ